MTTPQPLLTPVQLGPFTLPNRVVMAPLTRMRAHMPGNVPWEFNAAYYRQRATAGLIISEATPVSTTGYGYYGTPGIHTDEQTEGWKVVTNAVHEEGGRIFLQLWHVGRQSHEELQPGHVVPVAPSAISAGGMAMTKHGPKPNPVPRALDLEEIPLIVHDFARGAARAVEAGFDGVEIHGANGYLLEQFLSDHANHRTDTYGGSLENRARFFLEVVAAVVEVWGSERVGVRISPSNTFGGIEHTDRFATYAYLIDKLNAFNLAYIHLVEPRVAGNVDIEPAAIHSSVRLERGLRNINAAYVGIHSPAVVSRAVPDQLQRLPLEPPTIRMNTTAVAGRGVPRDGRGREDRSHFAGKLQPTARALGRVVGGDFGALDRHQVQLAGFDPDPSRVLRAILGNGNLVQEDLGSYRRVVVHDLQSPPHSPKPSCRK